MTTELKYVPHNSLILVGGGQKGAFLRNRGGAQHLDLVVEWILEQDNQEFFLDPSGNVTSAQLFHVNRDMKVRMASEGFAASANQ